MSYRARTTHVLKVLILIQLLRLHSDCGDYYTLHVQLKAILHAYASLELTIHLGNARC
jgi:hypothetical protein